MKAICGTFVGFAKFFVIFVLLGTIFQACSDDGEREKDVFGFEGGSKDKILTIEVVILDLHNRYQEFISIIAISPKDELVYLQEEIDRVNPRFKLYAPIDNKNLLHFLDKDEKHSYISLYDKQGEKVIDYVGLVPEEMVEIDIRYQIQDQLDAKAQYELQTLTPESQEVKI